MCILLFHTDICLHYYLFMYKFLMLYQIAETTKSWDEHYDDYICLNLYLIIYYMDRKLWKINMRKINYWEWHIFDLYLFFKADNIYQIDAFCGRDAWPSVTSSNDDDRRNKEQNIKQQKTEEWNMADGAWWFDLTINTKAIETNVSFSIDICIKEFFYKYHRFYGSSSSSNGWSMKI